MSLLRRCAALALIAAAMACASQDPTEPPAGFYRSTPRGTTRYLQWALEKRSHLHVWNCLSDGMKEREKISLTDLGAFFDRFEEEVTRYIGDVQNAVITEIVDETPRSKLVRYESGEHRATLRFVLETTWEIRPARQGIESAHGEVDGLDRLLRYEGDRALIEIPGVQPQRPPEEIEKILIDNAWKIDGVVDHNLDDLEEAARSRSHTRT